MVAPEAAHYFQGTFLGKRTRRASNLSCTSLALRGYAAAPTLAVELTIVIPDAEPRHRESVPLASERSLNDIIMTSLSSSESPGHTQYFLAILQGYSSRITQHQDAAKVLSEDHRKLQESLEELQRQRKEDTSRLDMQQELIRCQEKHISLLESSRSRPGQQQPPGDWTLPLPPSANWELEGLDIDSNSAIGESPRLDGPETPYPKRRRLTTALEEWDRVTS